MKKILLTCFLFLGACQALPVDTPLPGCPAAGLVAADFYAGRPEQDNVIAPLSGEDGYVTWSLEAARGNTFVVCSYANGEEVVQRLSPVVTLCQGEQKDKTGEIRVLCKASI